MEPHEMAEAAWEKEVSFQRQIFDQGVSVERNRMIAVLRLLSADAESYGMAAVRDLIDNIKDAIALDLSPFDTLAHLKRKHEMTGSNKR